MFYIHANRYDVVLWKLYVVNTYLVTVLVLISHHFYRVLQEDPELFQLYKDLVVSGIVSAEEFWANRTKPVSSF